jgi:hypothetical protein
LLTTKLRRNGGSYLLWGRIIRAFETVYTPIRALYTVDAHGKSPYIC